MFRQSQPKSCLEKRKAYLDEMRFKNSMEMTMFSTGLLFFIGAMISLAYDRIEEAVYLLAAFILTETAALLLRYCPELYRRLYGTDAYLAQGYTILDDSGEAGQSIGNTLSLSLNQNIHTTQKSYGTNGIQTTTLTRVEIEKSSSNSSMGTVIAGSLGDDCSYDSKFNSPISDSKFDSSLSAYASYEEFPINAMSNGVVTQENPKVMSFRSLTPKHSIRSFMSFSNESLPSVHESSLFKPNGKT